MYEVKSNISFETSDYDSLWSETDKIVKSIIWV